MTQTFTAFAAARLAAPLLATAAPATYAIDPTHTNVMFEALHFGTSTNRGRFIKSSGTVVFDRAGKTGKVELTLDMSAIGTGVAPFDNHLKGPDFFDVAKHPTATFAGDRFTFEGDKVTAVSGQLPLRGQTHPVTLTAERFGCHDNPIPKREVSGGDFRTAIKRSRWGANWGLDMGVADDTLPILQVEAVRQ